MDFADIIKKLTGTSSARSTQSSDSGSSSAANSSDSEVSVFSNNSDVIPTSSTEIDDEEDFWWEERLEEKKAAEEQGTEKSFDETKFDPKEWDSVEAKANNKFLSSEVKDYTFTTSNGTKINLEDIDGVKIYENKSTGEIIIAGANGATINAGNKDAKITIYDSDIKKLDTDKGNDEIKIYNSNVDKITTGRGIDNLVIENSQVDKINTGSGSDTVNIKDSTIGTANTSTSTFFGMFDDSEDTVLLENSDAQTLKTGRGSDNIIATDSNVNKLKSGGGEDALNLNETEVNKLKTNKKDTVVEDSNYLDIDKTKIAELGADAVIDLGDGTTTTVSEYSQYLLSQPVGFETEEEYQEYVLQSLTSNLETMKSVLETQEDKDGWLAVGYNGLKELTGLGISDKDVEEMIAKQEEMVAGLTAAINGESEMSFEEAYEYYTGTTYSKEKIDKYMEVSNTYSAMMVGCQYDENYMEEFENATGKSVEDVTKEYALCQLDTFGNSTGIQDLVEKYSQDQEGFADKLSAGITTFGFGLMITGAVVSFVFPPLAGLGMGMMTAGKYMSLGGMFVDNAMDLVEDSTDKDGLTKEELGENVLETGVEVVSYAAGRFIGNGLKGLKLNTISVNEPNLINSFVNSGTNGMNDYVTQNLVKNGVNEFSAKVLGQTVETATDTVLSLGADYAIAQGQSLIITGEFMESDEYWSLDRFLGEGKNQLMGILMGLSSTKVNVYQQSVIAIAGAKVNEGDFEGAKSFLKQSGIKMNDASFEQFVKTVQEAKEEIQTTPQIATSTETEFSKLEIGDTDAEITKSEQLKDTKIEVGTEPQTKSTNTDDGFEVSSNQMSTDVKTTTSESYSFSSDEVPRQATKEELLSMNFSWPYVKTRLSEAEIELCLEKGYSMEQAEKLHHLVFYRIAYSSPLSLEEASKYVDLTSGNTSLSRNLTDEEAGYFGIKQGMDIDTIQKIIDVIDNQTLPRKLTLFELKTLFEKGESYSEQQIKRYIEIIDMYHNNKIEPEKAKLFLDKDFDNEYISKFRQIERADYWGKLSTEDILLEIRYEDMGLSSRDISIIKNHYYSEQQAMKYAQLKKYDALDFYDFIEIIDGNYSDSQIHRYVELKSKYDMAPRNISQCITEFYSDAEVGIYSTLRYQPYATDYINEIRQQLFSRNLTSDESIRIRGKISLDKAQQFIDLKDNSSFSRNLTDDEAIFVIQQSYQPNQIQKMLDFFDNPKYKDILTIENVKYLLDNQLSELEIDSYIKKLSFLKDTEIKVYKQQGWNTYTIETNLEEWLKTFDVKPNDIKQDALDFVSKLNPEVLQYLTTFGTNNNYLARLLIKSDVFADVKFDEISKNAEFMNYLSETSVNGKNLLSKVENVAFLKNSDFDSEGMIRLIEAFKKVRITQPETQQYNFAMFTNLSNGHNSITDILNSSSIIPTKSAEFLEAMANIKITKSNGVEWSFADIFKENWLYNSIFDKNIDFDKVIQLCECISKSDKYSNLSNDDISEITWLINNVSTSKFSDSKEYFNAFNYFKNLSTDASTKILTGRKGRISETEILSYMLNIDPASVDASNFEMLINLVKEGIVGEHVFEYIPANGKLSSVVVQDIDKLYEAYELGIKPIDMFVPTFKNITEAMNGGNDSVLFKGTYLELQIGDVFQVDGEDFIRIKTSDSESAQLNISKETYFKLFPPIERYSSTQNSIGNCWEITAINSLLCEPDTRESVLKLFSQDGDDIIIKFPNGEYEEIRFRNGELPSSSDSQYFSNGALGVQMLEFADGKEMQGEWINSAYKKISDMIASETDENKREEFQKGLAQFTQFLEEKDGNVVISLRNGVHWQSYTGQYDSIMTENRDGGRSNSLYERLGYKDAQCLDFYEGGWQRAQSLLSDSKSFDNYIISWASDGKGIENSVNSSLGIVTNHAYRIKPQSIAEDGTVKTFKLINPWGIVETELTYKQVLDYGKALYIAKKG